MRTEETLQQCILLIDSNAFFFFLNTSDCPQVQCVEQYVAQQTDELTLEPTEIVNVIRKTNEGKNVGEETLLKVGILHIIHLVMA